MKFMIPNYIILDSARMLVEIETAKILNPQYRCLYQGHSAESLKQVAPYLFEYIPDSPFASWFEEQGWGDAWGLCLKADVSLEDLRHHFRKFLFVQTEAGEKLYFRFYDPRVLRIFLPNCSTEQLQEFFGPVKGFILEDEEPNQALFFSLNNGTLHTVTKAVSINRL